MREAVKRVARKPYSLFKGGLEESGMILDRLRKRDFTGYTGLAIKNSVYQIATSWIGKVGSLLFTMVLARMLMPELFGLYSLALSTIFLIMSISDLGTISAIVRFIAREKIKKKGNPGGYYRYLFNFKLTLVILTCFIFGLSANFLANNYYHKPIFLALIAGIFYTISNGIINFYSSVATAEDDFKVNMYKEIIFQVLRMIVLPITIILIIGLSTEWILFWVFSALSFCYLISGIYLYYKTPRYPSGEINASEKKIVRNFIFAMTSTIASGILFGYIDMIFLGRFLSAQYIGFYQTAFALIGSILAIVGFAGAVLYPLFNKMKKSRAFKVMGRANTLTFIIALAALIFTLFLAKYAILIVYGEAYLPSTNILRVLALLLLIDPFIAIYSSYQISLGRQNFVAWTLVICTVLNIVLNYTLISYLIRYSEYYASFGAAIAVIVSRGAYLLLLRGKK